MDRNHARPRYQAWMLRCWQELGLHRSGVPVWRFSVEDTTTGDRRGFASLAALVAWVQHELEPPPPRDGEAADD